MSKYRTAAQDAEAILGCGCLLILGSTALLLMLASVFLLRLVVGF